MPLRSAVALFTLHCESCGMPISTTATGFDLNLTQVIRGVVKNGALGDKGALANPWVVGGLAVLLNNPGIIGGLLILAAQGPGSISFNARRRGSGVLATPLTVHLAVSKVVQLVQKAMLQAWP